MSKKWKVPRDLTDLQRERERGEERNWKSGAVKSETDFDTKWGSQKLDKFRGLIAKRIMPGRRRLATLQICPQGSKLED